MPTMSKSAAARMLRDWLVADVECAGRTMLFSDLLDHCGYDRLCALLNKHELLAQWNQLLADDSVQIYDDQDKIAEAIARAVAPEPNIVPSGPMKTRSAQCPVCAQNIPVWDQRLASHGMTSPQGDFCEGSGMAVTLPLLATARRTA